jgi:hypothetical protein
MLGILTKQPAVSQKENQLHTERQPEKIVDTHTKNSAIARPVTGPFMKVW